jgi:triacylglycerol lipase
MVPQALAAPRLRRPIVLAHGLFGFDSIGTSRWRFRYFANLPDWLRASGNRVLVTRAHPVGRIATRAAQVAKQVENAFGSEPVHLFGHSMGGLDCRHLISHLGLGHRVRSLTTLGTPHRGSVVADAVCGWTRPKSATRAFLRAVGWEPELLSELSREGAARFNENTPDLPGVFYQSVAGVFPNSCRRDFRQLPHRAVTGPMLDREEGPNDGMVGEASARWGGAHETWPGDHFNLVNWVNPSERWPGINACRLGDFARLLARLEPDEHEGGSRGDDSAGTDGPGPTGKSTD